MATFKAVVLKGNKRNDGTFNINMRATHKRKSKYIKTNFVVAKGGAGKILIRNFTP